ncbi:hypothetical protein BDV29DRAFT_74650 [Aspergillus leporis]|uniref:Uncharacterized protein n=1 Tax=Aspergillus leporis TaxID=41062 RepID=A0A5N5WHZ5_9EURO|nr:hypothetical protein BDV29DRAFT_74650 [Aspergillus leporis]
MVLFFPLFFFFSGLSVLLCLLSFLGWVSGRGYAYTRTLSAWFKATWNLLSSFYHIFSLTPFSFLYFSIAFSLVLLLDICVISIMVTCNDKYKNMGIMGFVSLCISMALGV